MFPTVHGIAATDLDGAICYDEEGEPRLISELTDPHAKQLDRNILTAYLRDSIAIGDIVVVGHNTYKQMQPLLKKYANHVLVSTHLYTQEYLVGHAYYEKQPFNPNDDSRDQLVVRAFELATRSINIGNIHVLGGRSVYEAFAGHYFSFTHCLFKESFQKQKKMITVKPKAVTEARERETLLDSTMPFVQYIDSSMYSVKQYFY